MVPRDAETMNTSPPVTTDPGVSQRALSIARMVDRLETGEYQLHIEKKPAAQGGGWYVELQEAVTIRVVELEK